jgi:Uma2 family endonuclease
MATLPDPFITEEEYLRLEALALDKSEYHDGQMFAMAGGTPNHALLSNRIGALLDRDAPAGCRVYNADLRIYIAAAKTYTYPDCTVVCGTLQLAGQNLLNPLLICEVLSPSTENYDRGKKFQLYRTLESFREYLIIHQDRPFVEHYSKQDDGSWVLREYSGSEGSVTIPRLNARIALADLYASVVFETLG